MSPRVLAAYAVVVLVWGSTWGAIKIGVAEIPPWTFALERAIAVAVILGIVSRALGLELPKDRRVLAVATLVGAINTGISWAVIFWAERFVPSGLVAVFGATAPVWTAVLAHFAVRGDPLSARKVFAVLLGLAGVVFLVGASGSIEGGPAILATILLVIVPMGWAVTSVLSARHLTRVSPLPVIALGTAAGGVFLVPFAIAEIGQPVRWSVEAAVALAYLVLVGSCVGLVLNLWLYRRLRPTTIMLSLLLITTEAILIGALVLGEDLTPSMLVGAAFVIAAIALNATAGGPPRRGEVPEPAATPAA
ncbi:MAG TPA: EamA family transporter [Candidatus Limnocylindrales bacterium]|nr:EamA family transporter [Candidatus Limnocylindrales bacterium]